MERAEEQRDESQLADEAAVSVLLLAFAIFSGLTGFMLLFRRYAERQRQLGRTSMCFGCVELGEATVANGARNVGVATARSPESMSHRRREQLEESSVAALELLPVDQFRAITPDEVECSLCMVALQELEAVKKLPCGHMFHVQCVDRWLIQTQKHQRRRCPLCNAEPITAMQVVCPPGVSTGDTIQLKQPNGVFNVTVPAGVRPGGVFHLHLPAAVLGTPSGSDDASQPVANAQPAASASASELPSSC
mmetsp:Transcript_8453/g.20268  ORF Transcript_8453/g.20268 Transcript_8453/m.20268 type:complete len:249 (-) Transcript_8453:564-1310(-)